MQLEPDTIIVAVPVRDLPPGHARPACRKCECPDGYLARYIHTNGALSIRWVCEWCEDYKTAGDLPGSLLHGKATIEQLPVRVDHRGAYLLPAQCVICGSGQGIEFHHWAPRSIFPDWPDTSGVFLCGDHHHEWHAKMRAHGLRWPSELTVETW